MRTFVPAPLPRHIPELDGLRGIAILSVLVFHLSIFPLAGVTAPALVALRELCNLGWTGVDLFFVLSGFLITGILLSAKDQPHYFSYFYVRRALRILPLYYAFVFVAFVILFPIGRHFGRHPETAGEQIWYWLHLSNWRSAYGILDKSPVGHLWSLAIEEQYYLAWPVIVWWIPERRVLAVCLGIAAVSAALRWIPSAADLQAAPELLYRLTPFRLDGLALGGAVAALSRNPALMAAVLPWWRIACPAAVTVIIAAMFANGTGLYWGVERIILFPVGLAFACLLLPILAGEPWISRPLQSPVLRGFGKYSYALYLFHLPVTFLLHRLISGTGFVAWIAMEVCGVAISGAVALASWHLIEKRFLALKDRFEVQRAIPK